MARAAKRRKEQRTLPPIDHRAVIGVSVLSIVGIIVSIYLTYLHFAETTSFCPAGSGCDIVQASKYSTVLGMPVALLGLVGYVALLTAVLETNIPWPLPSI